MLALLRRITALNGGIRALASACANPGCPGPRLSTILERSYIVLQGKSYCERCFEGAVAEQISAFARSCPPPRRSGHRMPLGLLMVSSGVIEHGQVQNALRAQRAAGHGKIGYWLQQVGAISERDLLIALSRQFACPVFTLQRTGSVPPNILPFWLQEQQRILPVHWAEKSRTLWVAFAEAVYHSLLRAMEEILECRCEPCIVAEKKLNDHLQPPRGARNEAVFQGIWSPQEIAAIVRNYAAQCQADQARAAAWNGDVWIRLSSARSAMHLIFQSAITHSR